MAECGCPGAGRQRSGRRRTPSSRGPPHTRPPCGGHRSNTTQRLHDVIVVRGGGRAHAALSQALMDASATARLLLAFCVPPALVLLVAASSSSRTRVLFGTVWPRSAAGRSGGPPRHACGAGEGGDSAPGRRREVLPRKFLTNCRIMFLLQAYIIILSLVLLMCSNISRAKSRRYLRCGKIPSVVPATCPFRCHVSLQNLREKIIGE